MENNQNQKKKIKLSHPNNKVLTMRDAEEQMRVRNFIANEEEKLKKRAQVAQKQATARENRKLSLPTTFKELAMQLIDINIEDANGVINNTQKEITILKQKLEHKLKTN